ncbi:MAG: DNA polymerase III subunit gamma/tau [Candidatus Uhrbacteria bacterium]|nr:DNA polymerase III subunit gamma/tau [Candidatus Uhrbacteria bacterium]
MLALYRTYRPSVFSDVTGQEHVTHTLQNQILSGSVSHAYVFTGPRGIGKTTVARLLAKVVNCTDLKGTEPCNVCDACTAITNGKAMDVFEIDAASNTDVDNVRENIIRNVRFAPSLLKKKVYIIDEVHMLSTSAFNALLKTLEEPPAHALFILATTEIHKVPATILSRCQRFDFKKISKEAMITRLASIVKQEKRKVDDDVLVGIAKHSGGSERDAESMLGQILSLDEGTIGIDIASLVLPMTTDVIVNEFVGALSNQDAATAIRQLNANIEQGIDLMHFLDDVISSMRDQLLVAVVEKNASERMVFLNRAIELFLAARRHMRTDEIPQLPAELAIVELCIGGVEKAERANKIGNFNTTRVGSVRASLETPSVTPSVVDVIVAEKPFVEVVAEAPHVTLEPIAETETTVPVMEMIEEFVLEPVAIQPFTTSEHVFDSIPVISVDEVRRKWPEVFAQVQECNASLPLFLQACEVNSVGGDMVELAFEYDLYVQTVNKEKNRRLVESILERVLGKAVKIRAVLGKAKEKDDVVASLVDAFGGSAA